MWISWATNRNCSEYVTILSHMQELHWTHDYFEINTKIAMNMWISPATYRNCEFNYPELQKRNCTEHVTILSHKSICKGDYPESHTRTVVNVWIPSITYTNCTERVTTLSHIQELYWTCDYSQPHPGTVLNVWLPSAKFRNCTERVTTLSHIQELYWIGQIANSSTKSSILGRFVTWLINSNLSGHNNQYGNPTMWKVSWNPKDTELWSRK
jgi:hypothetical protein